MTTIDWRLSELMRMRGIRSTAALHRRLAERTGEAPGLSQAQVYRLTEGPAPALLNLDTLGALCAALDTTPAELLTRDVAGVQVEVLDVLLDYLPMANAHYKLCGYGRRADVDDPMMEHPGDPFGNVLAWLWRSGRSVRATQLVADYLTEMRRLNPNHPAEGSRLTWSRLRRGIRMAINTPYKLTEAELDALCTHLDETVADFCGAPLAELERP